jgi:hypothetical protein
MSRRLPLIALALGSALTWSAAAPGALLQAQAPQGAAAGPPGAAVDAAQKREVIDALGRQLQVHYVFPEVAATLATQLKAKQQADGYAGATDSKAFAKALTEDLRTLGKDKHFTVVYQPGKNSGPGGGGPGGMDPAKLSFGIDRVQRLPGNIGYLELRAFMGGKQVEEAISDAMNILRGTDAMIVDLRRNGGGEPATVAWLMSHFFAADDKRHLNDIYNRPNDTTESFHTDPAAPVHFTGPVYVLTSKQTFSGGEEAAYDFQTQKRGIVVGEVTGGGANPGDIVPLAAGFKAVIPSGRAINPVTKTNWEGVGVQPDIAVPAPQALKVAHTALLRAEMAKNPDPQLKQQLAKILAEVEAGQGYVP